MARQGLAVPNLNVSVAILPVVTDLGNRSSMLSTVSERQHWLVKYQANFKGLRDWQWRTTDGERLKKMKYGLITVDGMVIDVVNLGQVKLTDSDAGDFQMAQFPHMTGYDWHFARKVDQWDPWSLQVLIAHTFKVGDDAAKLTVKTLGQLMWDYDLRSVSDAYVKQFVESWAMKHGQTAAMNAEHIALVRRMQAYLQTIPVADPLNGYMMKTLFKLYADWDTVAGWQKWMNRYVMVTQ